MTMFSVKDLIASDKTGFACSKTKLVGRGLPHLRPFNIDDSGLLNLTQIYHVPENEAPNSKEALQTGDILFNNTNSAELVGKSALVERPMLAGFSNHITRIRVDISRVEPAYFSYWLRNLRQQGVFTSAATQWVSQAAYKTSELKRLFIPLPPLHEQRHLVDLLSRAEGIVHLRREAQKKAAELIPALFLDMFGDPASNPKGWAVAPLHELGQLDRGKSKHRPRDAQELYGGSYPFIQTGDVTNSGGQISRYAQTYSDLGLAQSRLWPVGTLCITIAANIARTGILTFDACFPDSVVGFTPSDKVTVEYIQHWLGFLQPMLERIAPQAAQKNINLKILRELPVPLPPMKAQTIFAERVASISSLSKQQVTATTKAQSTFNALLHRAFASA